MKNIIKENWKFILIVILISIIGGYFTGLYSLEMLDSNILNQALEQFGDQNTFILIVTIQTVIYTIVSLLFGLLLSNKLRLWKKIKIRRKPVNLALLFGLIGGFCLIVPDLLIFSRYSNVIASLYNAKPSTNFFLSAISYGGVIEEIMMRLFLMSLISFIMYKLFYRNEEKAPDKVFIIANIITAILFAAGHLPNTYASMGLSFIIVLRCFLLNGAVGLLFGWLYRKYGIIYAMMAHIGCHVVSKIIWMLFI